MSDDLAGSVAVVTGGGRGIGRVLAVALADAGAAVGLVARSADQLAETAALIESRGGRVESSVADVTDEVSMRAALESFAERLGPIGVLVNNAGVDGRPAAMWEADPDAWWRTMEVNVRGVMLGCRLVVPGMIARGSGRIVNITSQAGVFRWPLMSAYSVSKAAVVKLTENLAVECRRTGVSVFSVHPGLTAIGFSEQARYQSPVPGSPEERVARWVSSQLEAGHGADPSLSASLVVRLARGDGDALTGCHLSVHDDLDALVAAADDVRARDLHVLRTNTL